MRLITISERSEFKLLIAIFLARVFEVLWLYLEKTSPRNPYVQL
jgi:hypothetical protein